MDYTTKYQSIVLMGKIASGKGTQAEGVINSFGGVLYSNGNLLRETIKLPTVFGKKMKEMYESGYLMPEWIASYWMTHALVGQYEHERVVFEAVARKPNEAELFHEIHEWLNRSYIIFNIEVSDDIVMQRSLGRARDGLDTPKSVEKRLDEFHTYTAHSIEYFRKQGTLIDIDGEASPEEVQEKIINYLKE